MPLAKGTSRDAVSRIRNWDNSPVGSFKEMSRWKNENGPPFIHFEAFAEPIYCDIDARFQTIRPELQGFQTIFYQAGFISPFFGMKPAILSYSSIFELSTTE